MLSYFNYFPRVLKSQTPLGLTTSISHVQQAQKFLAVTFNQRKYNRKNGDNIIQMMEEIFATVTTLMVQGINCSFTKLL